MFLIIAIASAFAATTAPSELVLKNVTVSTVRATATVKASTTVTAVVYNGGGTTASNFYVDLSNTATTAVRGTVYTKITSLAAGGSATVRLTLSNWNPSTTGYPLVIDLDRDAHVAESNERNNQMSIAAEATPLSSSTLSFAFDACEINPSATGCETYQICVTENAGSCWEVVTDEVVLTPSSCTSGTVPVTLCTTVY